MDAPTLLKHLYTLLACHDALDADDPLYVAALNLRFCLDYAVTDFELWLAVQGGLEALETELLLLEYEAERSAS